MDTALFINYNSGACEREAPVGAGLPARGHSRPAKQPGEEDEKFRNLNGEWLVFESWECPKSWRQPTISEGLWYVCCVLPQEGYLSKVKALLGRELCVENGSHVDGVEQNGKTNGAATNGSHEGEGAMDTHEDAEAMKSPSAPKGKGGRKSKTDSEPKSKLNWISPSTNVHDQTPASQGMTHKWHGMVY